MNINGTNIFCFRWLLSAKFRTVFLFSFVCIRTCWFFNLIIYSVFNFGYVLYRIDKGDDDDDDDHHHHHRYHYRRTICTMTSFYFYCQRPPGSVTKNIARIWKVKRNVIVVVKWKYTIRQVVLYSWVLVLISYSVVHACFRVNLAYICASSCSIHAHYGGLVLNSYPALCSRFKFVPGRAVFAFISYPFHMLSC